MDVPAAVELCQAQAWGLQMATETLTLGLNDPGTLRKNEPHPGGKATVSHFTIWLSLETSQHTGKIPLCLSGLEALRFGFPGLRIRNLGYWFKGCFPLPSPLAG